MDQVTSKKEIKNEVQSVGNAVIFADVSDAAFILSSIEHVNGHRRMFLISEDPAFLRQGRAVIRLSPGEIGLDRDQMVVSDILSVLRQWMDRDHLDGCFVIDMSWVARKLQGALAIEAWGDISERLCDAFGMPVISVYNRELLVEDVLLAAFRAHRQIVVPSGCYQNPFWIPAELANQSAGEQMSFVLGRIVPDYQGARFFERDDRFAAAGADPDWVVRSNSALMSTPPTERWQIYCLGQLRVYRNGTERINWNIKGGAPKKTRTLFAYLLTHGERGAHVDRIAELLWPDEGGTEKSKRARLHHTVAMLRKTLGGKDSVLRSGDFYRLNPPEGSWVDITNFEQLCRRGVSLFKRGQREEAQLVYSTAEKLYAGDLFADIPWDYIENEQDDWCMARRVWLREVALKLQRDFSALLREQGRLRAALEHCQKGLAIDPSNEDVNIETLKVFHAQGRLDAVARQYRQYKKAMEAIGSTPEGSEVQSTFLALTRR